MRWINLIETIDTSAIERMVRSTIVPQMTSYVKMKWEEYLTTRPAVNEKEWTETRFQYFDDFRESIVNDPEQKKNFALVFSNQPSIALAKATRKMSGVNCLVLVRVREYTDDKMKNTSGGYFTFNRGIQQYQIVIFVDERDVLGAAEQILHDVIFGEIYEDHVEMFINKVASVFVHEYAHLQQELRNPNRPITNGVDRDVGLITTNGGRYGNRRSPKESKVHWARYAGSLMEIDSFASQTASELIGAIRAQYGRSTASNEEINRVLADIAQGWGSGAAYDHMSHMKRYWDDFAAAGIDPTERDRVWKRYLKRTYQKIWLYREDELGKTPSYRRYSLQTAPQEWKNAASKGMVKCIHQIANDIAFQLRADIQSGKSLSEVSNDPLITEGVTFIENYFFGDMEDYAESMKVAIAARRHIERTIEARAQD